MNNPDVTEQPKAPSPCPVCNEQCTSDDDLFVHVYLNHPEVSDNISKMMNGEPYKTAAQLRDEGILTPNAALSEVADKKRSD